MDESLNRATASIIHALGDRSRILVAIAGPPGAGKSTLSSQICKRLDHDGRPTAIVPMDGFHLDNAVLRDRNLLHRKGAPETFDAEGFIRLVQDLRTGNGAVAVPEFDRESDRVQEAATRVAPVCRVVLLEGNYLLLDRQPWTRVQRLFDLSIFIKAPEALLRRRLVQRWLDLGHEQRDAERRANGNDIPNATLVLEHSVPANVTLVFESDDE